MAVRRRPHDRPLEGAGPGCRRVLVIAFGAALILGLLIGVIWVIAGIIRFQVFG